MSNCIDIVNGSDRVVFLRDEIDAVALKALVDSATKEDGEHGDKDEAALARHTAWWYLKRNSVIDHRGAVVYLGRGESSHTDRSFKATLLLLCKFMKKAKYHTFFITDEGDRHSKVYREVVEFNAVLKIDGETLAEKDARLKEWFDKKYGKIDYSKIKVRTLTEKGWEEDGKIVPGPMPVIELVQPKPMPNRP